MAMTLNNSIKGVWEGELLLLLDVLHLPLSILFLHWIMNSAQGTRQLLELDCCVGQIFFFSFLSEIKSIINTTSGKQIRSEILPSHGSPVLF